MAKYAGHHLGAIVSLTHRPLGNSDLTFVRVPQTLEATADKQLIADYVVRGDRVVPKYRLAADARIALVTVWDVPCGIATYSKALADEIRPRVADLHIFAEHEGNLKDTADVTRCWKRGQTLKGLSKALIDYAPDAIFIQHEYGNFPRADHWLALMSALMNHRVLVTLHSVYAHHDKAIVEAACHEIIVHTAGAKGVLRRKGVSAPINLIAHGCQASGTRDKLWNLYATPHTILQHGFGFSYKGWESAIRTIAKLRTRYPDVFYTGLMAERWNGDHAAYQRKLYSLAADLGIADRVGLIRGYQADNVLDAFLRTNQVAFFPYIDNGQHTVYGCSGAARSAMAAGVPVVTSNVPLFEDIAGIVPQPDSIDGWATAISSIFEEGRDVTRQDAFLAAHTWATAARAYLSIVSRIA